MESHIYTPVNSFAFLFFGCMIT